MPVPRSLAAFRFPFTSFPFDPFPRPFPLPPCKIDQFWSFLELGALRSAALHVHEVCVDTVHGKKKREEHAIALASIN